jgi:hypothetical protein
MPAIEANSTLRFAPSPIAGRLQNLHVASCGVDYQV